MRKKVLSIFLALVMVLCLAPTMALANDGTGDNTDKTIMLGTNGISAYDENTGKADSIYYGVYMKDGTSYNVPWHVISFDTENNTGFMLSKYTLGNSEFRNELRGYYAGSKLQTVMNGLYNGENTSLFTGMEQGAINATTLIGSSMYSTESDIKNAHLFPLSIDEAESLRWKSDILKAKDITNPDGKACWWWLRSSDPHYAAAYVASSGDYWYDVMSTCDAVRPAFNLNLNSVLFTSLISTTDTGSEYKLTLLDDNMTITKTDGANVTMSNNTLTIPYTVSGTNSANATHVSVLVLNNEYTVGNTNNANILAYGKLNTESFSATGSGTFTLPDTVDGKTLGTDYYVYILAEDVNGTYETDYASAPLEISEVTDVAKAPAANVESGTYTESQSIVLTSETEGAFIYYTADGTDPSFDKDGNPTGTTTLYTTAISVTGTQGTSISTTIKAVAVKSGMINSAISEFAYTIVLPHVHDFDGSRWQSDDTKHWRKCTNANCDKSEGYIEEAEHIASDWITDKSATASETGSRHKECTVCGKVLEEETIAKLVPAEKTNAPQTGDSSNMFLWLALLLVSGGAVTVATIANNKRKYNR